MADPENPERLSEHEQRLADSFTQSEYELRQLLNRTLGAAGLNGGEYSSWKENGLQVTSRLEWSHPIFMIYEGEPAWVILNRSEQGPVVVPGDTYLSVVSSVGMEFQIGDGETEYAYREDMYSSVTPEGVCRWYADNEYLAGVLEDPAPHFAELGRFRDLLDACAEAKPYPGAARVGFVPLFRLPNLGGPGE